MTIKGVRTCNFCVWLISQKIGMYAYMYMYILYMLYKEVGIYVFHIYMKSAPNLGSCTVYHAF